MKIDVIIGRINETNTYLIQKEKKVIIVDVGDWQKIDEFVQKNNLEVKYIYLTHEHWDHIYGLEKLRSIYKAPVICSEKCSRRMQEEKWNLSKYIKIIQYFKDSTNVSVQPFKVKKAECCFKDMYEMDFGGTICKFFELKGHSEGSSCLMIENKLFVGDSILEKEEDIFCMPNADKNAFYTETLPMLQQILKIETNVEVFPGHGEKMDLEHRLKMFNNRWRRKG